MIITIKDRGYEARYTLKAQMIWEEAEKKPFAPQTVYEIYLYYYCIIIACNKGAEDTLSLEEFLDACSEDATIGEQLLKVVTTDVEESQKKKRSLASRILMWVKSLLSSH